MDSREFCLSCVTEFCDEDSLRLSKVLMGNYADLNGVIITQVILDPAVNRSHASHRMLEYAYRLAWVE